jgi:hypothetical protein
MQKYEKVFNNQHFKKNLLEPAILFELAEPFNMK